MRWLAPLVFLFLAVVISGCAGTSASSPRAAPVFDGREEPAGRASTTEIHLATVPAPPRPPVEPRFGDPRERAEREAAAVFRAMHPQILACLAKQRAGPRGHTWFVVDVVVGGDGRPREVATTGGAPLEGAVLECVARHVRAASFVPPAISGTSRVSVPFAFHPEGG